MQEHDLPIEQQVADVLAGLTVSGEPDEGPIAFPGGRVDLLHRWANGFPRGPDDVRTAFIRKLAHFIAHADPGPDTARDLADGTTWFICHPEKIRTPLTFATAIRMSRDDFSSSATAYASMGRLALRKAASKQVPDQPVIFDDGPHRLIELVHPAHLIETGLHSWNCLVRRTGNTLECNGSYWCRIADESLRIFALWKGPSVMCVFSIGEGALQEWQYVAPPATVNPVLPAVLAALIFDTGPMGSGNAVFVHGGMALDPHTTSVRLIRRALQGGDDA